MYRIHSIFLSLIFTNVLNGFNIFRTNSFGNGLESHLSVLFHLQLIRARNCLYLFRTSFWLNVYCLENKLASLPTEPTFSTLSFLRTSNFTSARTFIIKMTSNVSNGDKTGWKGTSRVIFWQLFIHDDFINIVSKYALFLFVYVFENVILLSLII